MLKQKIHTWNPFFWLWILFIKIYTIIRGVPHSPPSPPTVSDYTSIYQKKNHDQFIKVLTEKVLTEKALTEKALTEKSTYNTNTDACLYHRKECTELMVDPENELEKKWKSRILFETTPRGNIIMHYNPFKNAFAYYCDNASLPYIILNAVVMKYVLVYRCIDLFIDEHVSGEHPSPLIQLIKDYEKEQDKKPETEKLALPKSKAFAKFKNYSKPATDNSDPNKPESTTPKMINSIVYMGKIANFSFIQKSSKKKAGFKSKLLEGLDSQTKITSWRDFKKQTQTPPESKPLHEEIQEFMEKTELINDAINAAIENISQSQTL
jgi:hypothetical protein